MQTIAKYRDYEKANVDRLLLLQSGIYTCISGSTKTGYELLAAKGLAERALKIIPREVSVES